MGRIRDSFLKQERLAPSLLNQMRKDSRRGVRQIYRLLVKRLEKKELERRRIRSMLHSEHSLWKSGIALVAGVDEVGVGPLAGPVVAAAVIFPSDVFIAGVDDSKRLSPHKRNQLAKTIKQQALAIQIGSADVAEIDELNIYHAAVLAMRRAVESLPLRPGYLLVDAKIIPEMTIPQSSFIKGDRINFSIAAASIIAKTSRDQLMLDLDRRYPQYGLATHKGYGTVQHQTAIKTHGPSPIHRKSFTFIRELCGQYCELFYLLRKKVLSLSSTFQLEDFAREFEAVSGRLETHERRKIRLLLARQRKHFASSQ